MDEIMFTVFTPVFNRRQLINRVYNSLVNQTYQKFEWLVVDDGSTDGLNEDIQKYQSISKFEIIYYYTENCGKPSATNLAYKHAKGKYFIVLDSDDELVPTALEYFLESWVKVEQNKDIWCICMLSIDPQTNKIDGRMFDPRINDVSDLKRKRLLTKSKGEHIGCQLTSIARNYPYPIFTDTKFISESLTIKQIEKNYKQFYVNKIARIYHKDSTDSITISYKRKTKENYASSYYYSQYVVNHCIDTILYDPIFYVKRLIDLSRSGLGSKRSIRNIINNVNGIIKLIVLVFMPIGFLLYTCEDKGIKY